MIGLRTNVAGVTLEISDIYATEYIGDRTGLTFGTFADSGETNEYGTVYNLTQGWSSEKDLGVINQGVMRSSLKTGHNALRFYMYNPNESDVTFYLSENTTWAITDVTTLKAKAWTEVEISREMIISNDNYLTYLCVSSGANTSGWQISPIYSCYIPESKREVESFFGVCTDTGTTN